MGDRAEDTKSRKPFLAFRARSAEKNNFRVLSIKPNELNQPMNPKIPMSKKTMRFQKLLTFVTAFISLFIFTQTAAADSVVIDHNTTEIIKIPESAIEQAKNNGYQVCPRRN